MDTYLLILDGTIVYRAPRFERVPSRERPTVHEMSQLLSRFFSVFLRFLALDPATPRIEEKRELIIFDLLE